MPGIDVVLFDLGGVLIDFSGVDRMRVLAGLDHADEVWRRWLACDWVRAFERGGCSADDFASGVIDDWGLSIEPAELLAEFSGWVGAALPGAEELVAQTRRSRPTGCLSNTNALHWAAWQRWPFLDDFDHRFLSFQLGAVKPDAELFDAVAERLPVPPGSVLFVDDNQINVDGARSCGFRAERAQGPAEARAVLETYGVL